MWFDRVLAVPTIGLRFEPDFVRLTERIQNLAPLWKELHDATPINLKWLSPSSMEARTKGWRYSVSANELVVQFSYDFLIVQSPGGLPRFQDAEMRTYSSLQQEAVERTTHALRLMIGEQECAIIRIGVVITAELSLEEPPPGVGALIEHIGKPWRSSGGLIKSSGELLMALAEEQTHQDRCFHNLTFDKTSGTDLTLKLDWQRYYKANHTLRADAAPKYISRITGDATTYFQKVGAEDYGT